MGTLWKGKRKESRMLPTNAKRGATFGGDGLDTWDSSWIKRHESEMLKFDLDLMDGEFEAITIAILDSAV